MPEFFRTPVGMMCFVIVSLLAVASVTVAVLRAANPEKNWSELTSRVRAWWGMAAIFFSAAMVSDVISLVFFALMCFWALKEYLTLLDTRPADHGALLWAFLSIPIQFYWIYTGWYGMFIIFIPVYVFLFLPMRLVLTQQPSGFIRSASQLHWGLMLFVFGLSHLAFLNKLALDTPAPGVDGKSALLFLVFTTEAGDICQYIWGKLTGRHKIIPGISPNKTWEGFVGGVLTAACIAVAIRFLTPFETATEAFAVGLCIGVAGFFGDVVMSAVKRDFGVKDFGASIPGHGGMLDRLDSLCYTAPLFLHYIRYFHS